MARRSSFPRAPAAPTPPLRSAPGWRAPPWPSSRTASCATSRSRCEADEPLEIVTDRSGQDALDLIRHDAAHVLAAAVMDLYPGRRRSPSGRRSRTASTTTSTSPTASALSDADFEAIEAKMREHIAADEPFTREDVSVEQALERFRGEGQDYKVELIEDLVRERRRRHRLALHATARSPTCAAGRTRRARSASARSSCSRSPAPTGAATPTARCSRASTGRPSSSRPSSTRSSSSSSRRGRATTASSGRELGPLHLLAAVTGLDLLAARRAPRCSTRWSRSTARMQQERGYVEVKTPHALRVPAVGDLRALGQVQGQHLRLRVRGPRVRRSSR